MVEQQPSKLMTTVRFRSPAPSISKAYESRRFPTGNVGNELGTPHAHSPGPAGKGHSENGLAPSRIANPVDRAGCVAVVKRGDDKGEVLLSSLECALLRGRLGLRKPTAADEKKPARSSGLFVGGYAVLQPTNPKRENHSCWRRAPLDSRRDSRRRRGLR